MKKNHIFQHFLMFYIPEIIKSKGVWRKLLHILFIFVNSMLINHTAYHKRVLCKCLWYEKGMDG